MIKTVIFDLDGTLLDTLDDLTDSFNFALTSFLYPPRTKEEFKSFVGDGIKKAIERAVPKPISDAKLEEMTENFKLHYKKHMCLKTKAYEGINETLKALKFAGIKTGVVSNKFDDAVKMLCDKYFPNLIDCAVGEGYEINRKPDASGVLKVIEELNAEKESTIYIGDSDTDIKTAKNAGIKCISVLWGFRDKDFLEKSGATTLTETPNDLLKICMSM